MKIFTKTALNKHVLSITIFACAAIVFAIILFTSGCNTNLNNSHANSSDQTQTITDIYDRDVEVPKTVNSIASAGSAARICVYAGCADKLSAITEMDKPNVLRPYTIAYAQKFDSLPTTSNGNHINQTDIDAEKLLEINPDVIVSSRSATECQELQDKINIPVVGVYFQDELFGDKLIRSIQILGNLCSTQKTAQARIDFLRECQQELITINSNNSPVYRGAVNFKGSKGLTGTVSHYPVYEALNINNIAYKQQIQGSYDTDIESIVAANPDYVFIDYPNIERVRSEYNQYKTSLLNCNAFKNGKTYCCAPFNNNGTNVEYGLCEAYYTALILNSDNTQPNSDNTFIEQKFANIYTNLLGQDISSQLAAQGVRFEQIAL